MRNENEEEEIKIPKKMGVVKAMDLIKMVRKEPEPVYLWNGIPEKSMGLITGVGKTGKTTFAENLGISIAVGKKEFFGEKLSGSPKKVLFVNLEESYRVRSRRNYRQLQRLNKKELALFEENYFSTPKDFLEYINSEDDWKCLSEYIELSDAELVIIDSLTHMFKGQIEQSDPARTFTEKLKIFLRALDKTYIIVHHNIKGNEKPIDQDSIAGSRVITQEFEYAYGLANIPTSNGNYLCPLFNKHTENDSTKAMMYEMEGDGWVKYLGLENKFNLYKENKVKRDGRYDTTNKDLLYEYVSSQTSTSNPTITTSVLKEHFVENNTMSKDTLYKSLNKLAEEDIIVMVGKGIVENKIFLNDGEV